MTNKEAKIPGPDHSISIEANPSRVVATVGGKIIAGTRAALTLSETSYPAVRCIPRGDVDTAAPVRSGHDVLPLHGYAACYSIPASRNRSMRRWSGSRNAQADCRPKT